MNARDEMLNLLDELDDGHAHRRAFHSILRWLPLNKVEEFLDDFKRIELAN